MWGDKTHPQIWEWDYLGMKPLLREITQFTHSLPGSYRLLDLGCGSKPYRSLFKGATEYIGLDIVPGPQVDIVGEAWHLPFPDASFDVLITTQVFEHTMKLTETMAEIRRVVKPGGYIFISAPFAFQEHGAPYDYWRFTQFGLRTLAGDLQIDRIVPLQGFFLTQRRLLNAFLINHGPRPFFEYLLIPIVLWNNCSALILDWLYRVIILGFIPGVLKLILRRPLKTYHEHYRREYWALPENYCMVIRNQHASNG
ncbi:MAG: class I SAM-dependent methyltransferase [Candidatus Kerfeldbacteria bacterium]|nr:class I SAM-dependent methyltransferase [Candidatus Kerfeldbacteria bacterium]